MKHVSARNVTECGEKQLAKFFLLSTKYKSVSRDTNGDIQPRSPTDSFKNDFSSDRWLPGRFLGILEASFEFDIFYRRTLFELSLFSS